MKQFSLYEGEKAVWRQMVDETVVINATTEAVIKYSRHADYFEKLLETIGKVIENVDLVLNVTKEATLMTLRLESSQLPMAKSIKSVLLENFPEEIEQIGIVEKECEMNILDYLFEYRC